MITSPPKPPPYTRPELGTWPFGANVKCSVRQWIATSPLTIQAEIKGDPKIFTGVSINAASLTLQKVNPADLPHLPGRPTTAIYDWVRTPAGSSDGAPLHVATGNMVEVSVALNLPFGTPPGRFSGTLIIGGDPFGGTLNLTGTCLSFDPTSPIGRKYTALGGANVLGNPLDLPHDLPNGLGSMMHFEHGAIWQVSATDAFLVGNPILGKWNDNTVTQNNIRQTLGVPIEDSFTTSKSGFAQRFKDGLIVVRADKRACVVYGAIWDCYKGLGDVRAPGRLPAIGWPTFDEMGWQGGRLSPFDQGEIHYSGATGAHEVRGAILARWKSANLFGTLGRPTSNEIVAADGVGRYSRFEHGIIAWVARFGAFEVPAALATAWEHAKSMNGWLGYPTAVTQNARPPQSTKVGTLVRFQYGSGYLLAGNEVIIVPDEKTFSAQIETPSGTALGGQVSLTVRSNATWDFTCHVHDSGADDYSFGVRLMLTTANGVALALQASGSVEGHIIGDSGRNFSHTELNTITDPAQAADLQLKQQIVFLQDHWPDIADAKFSVAHSYKDTGALGTLEDAVHDIASWLVGAAVGGPALATIVLLGSSLGKHLGVRVVGPGGIVGVIVAGASVMVLGPLGFTVGMLAGAVGAAVIKYRTISDAEYAFANRIFKGQLPPQSQLILTNVASTDSNADGGRKFTMPNVDGSILLNLGEACFHDPMNWAGTVNYFRPGQCFIHELTHAWQIYHRTSLGVLCDFVTKRRAAVDADAYHYGTPDTAFVDFGLEQQAHIVDDWYGGSRTAAFGHTSNMNDPEDFQDPFFHYIANNIWLGDPG